MENIRKLKEGFNKFKAAAITAGVGLAAITGAGAFAHFADDQPQPVNAEMQPAQNNPKEISNQVDENKDKLQALSSDSESSNPEYELMGC